MAAASAPLVVGSYRGGGFTVTGTRHDGSIILFRDRVLPWPVARVEEIDADSLAALVAAAAARVELLLLGCGARLVPVAPDLRAALKARGIAVEPMDTGAACRTFNVLTAEERRVAAALIAVA
ncbi:MAG: Mth938-like domain-containing protein [Alphaproteobacteria bacterium]|nr:Mth938-like domain-containing protein [Alphaproteobacteria bacterium]